ncbi:hypothetical protein Clacol_007776 [Clathrus columnatus]|uniref:Uncharacterized protein n=1 Tax=Clathrus columnatus TaxID=1419009 RepID=A0AAV5AID2_9AGAM|nr:hypothetical protein Clacol_007776 [Clathrus columnatus]
MSLKGLYIIRPRNASNEEALVDRWSLVPADNNTYNAITGNGKSDDYKWIKKVRYYKRATTAYSKMPLE